mgnify:CR=1 FL=1
MRIHFEDVMFWIMILAIIGIVLWMLHGSPTDSGAIVGIGAFVATSEILIWKRIFRIERDTSIGFVRVKHDLKLMESNIINKLDDMER